MSGSFARFCILFRRRKRANWCWCKTASAKFRSSFSKTRRHTRHAAGELALYMEKISRAKPQIIEGKPASIPERAIWVGFQPHLQSCFRGWILIPNIPKKFSSQPTTATSLSPAATAGIQSTGWLKRSEPSFPGPGRFLPSTSLKQTSTPAFKCVGETDGSVDSQPESARMVLGRT